MIQKLVRARAEWVLRWILDKLKNDAETGAEARTNPKVWKLLDWMVKVLPTSRSALQLRDADFLSILERTLRENFGNDSFGTEPHIKYDADINEDANSSQKIQASPVASRKRKRQANGDTMPVKKVALRSEGLVPLFGGIFSVIKSIIAKSRRHGGSDEIVQQEHMKMTLRTDSSQAARILKGWVIAISKLLERGGDSGHAHLDDFLELGLVLEIWEQRTTSGEPSTNASADQFSGECLIPVLVLYSQLQKLKAPSIDFSTTAQMQSARETLERLLARHTFSPARSAFFVRASTQTNTEDGIDRMKSEELANNLEPLRAKILQAAQIQDQSFPIPQFFRPLFASISKLLDMAIRMSPSRTPRSKVAERPWLQAVFIALMECAGFTLEAPKLAPPEASLRALQKCLEVLALNDIRIDNNLLAQIFWYHSGVKYPLNSHRKVHWTLISALIKLDPDTFVNGASASSSVVEDIPEDLARFLFEQISALGKAGASFVDSDAMDIDGEISSTPFAETEEEVDDIVTSVVLPLMSAFSRNRDLSGFITRWDEQLIKKAPIERGAFTKLHPPVWEDKRLSVELSGMLEQSMTTTQISSLFELHANRVNPDKEINEEVNLKEDETRNAYSSAVILRALLWSISSDDLVESLRPRLRCLLDSFTKLVRDKHHRKHTDLPSCWQTLSRLVNLLWPLDLHPSKKLQSELLVPLIKQAEKDIGRESKKSDETPVSSKARAAALLFMMTACDHLRTVPGYEEALTEHVRRILKYLAVGQLNFLEFCEMLQIFCIEFPQLLEYLEPDKRQSSLVKLLNNVSDLKRGDRLDPRSEDELVAVKQAVTEALSQAIFNTASSAVREAFAAALIKAMNHDDWVSPTAIDAMLQVQPTALSRDSREALLNELTEEVRGDTRYSLQILSIMARLQEAYNATAKLSSDGRIFFKMAEELQAKVKLPLEAVELFQKIVEQTLKHMLPNKDQAQNKKYFEKFSKNIKALLQKPNEYTPFKLAIARGAMVAQKNAELVAWDTYLEYLATCLPSAFKTPGGVFILERFAELPSEGAKYEVLFDGARDSLSTHLGGIATTGTYLDDENISEATRSHIHGLIAKYKLYDDLQSYVELSRQFMRKTSPKERHAVTAAVEQATSALSTEDKLDLLSSLLDDNTESADETTYELAFVIISGLEDKAHDDPEHRAQQLALLPKFCMLVTSSPSSATFASVLDVIDKVIREKPSLTSQHNIECVLTALVKLSSRNSPSLPSSDASAIYTRLAETTRSLLLLHHTRSRLGGRFQLLLPLLQNLLMCLYIPHAGRYNALPAWLRPTSGTSAIHLTPTNASQYSRILSTLCSPTLSSVSKSHLHRVTPTTTTSTSTKSTLNDPVKAAREYVSHYLYSLLASFCRFQLNGRLDAGVREKLLPGLWDAVGTAGMDREALNAMYAGLDKSSREIWKGVWEEWKRVEGRTREELGKGKKEDRD